MQKKNKRCRNFKNSATFFNFFGRGKLLGSFDGDFAEILEVFDQFQGGLTGTGTGGFVTFHDLGFGVLGEFCTSSIDFFNKLFHNGCLIIIGLYISPYNLGAR